MVGRERDYFTALKVRLICTSIFIQVRKRELTEPPGMTQLPLSTYTTHTRASDTNIYIHIYI